MIKCSTLLSMWSSFTMTKYVRVGEKTVWIHQYILSYNSIHYFFKPLLNILPTDLINVSKLKLNDDCCFVSPSILFTSGTVENFYNSLSRYGLEKSQTNKQTKIKTKKQHTKLKTPYLFCGQCKFDLKMMVSF